MRRMNRAAVAIGVFLLGCATGGAASRYVASANAQSLPPGATAWRYTCFREDDLETIDELSNRLGSQGWELAASALSGGAPQSDPIWCFKRRQ